MQRTKAFILIFIDLALLFLSLFITTCIYKGEVDFQFYAKHLYPFSIIFPVWIVMYFIEGLYSLRTFNPDGLVISCIRSQLINSVFAFLFFYLFTYTDITPRANVFILAGISFVLIYLWRKTFYKLFSHQGLKINTVTFAADELIDEIEKNLVNKPFLGFNISKRCSLLDIKLPKNTDLIVIDRSLFRETEFLDDILLRMNQNISFMDISNFFELITGKVPVKAIDQAWLIENCGRQPDKLYWLLKNLLDRTVALFIFFLCLPIYLILLPILFIFSGRPIFYSQTRTGFRNNSFTIHKLRTMKTDAEKSGAKWATPGDSRVTRVGKFLRMSRLDELPQLWNIINGDMSLVGPRPERPEMIQGKLDKNIPFYNFRHLVKPGVTGWAQVNFGYGYSEDDSMSKLQYDLYYVKNKSIWLDIKIILRTIKTVITGMGH